MTTLTRREISPTESEHAATDAFIFGYPLVLMGRMRGDAPANVFAHQRAVHGSASPDTLASSAWLDLHDGPVVLSVPHCHGRYYVLSLVDMWTRVFASIGPRTTGTGAGSYAICGPRWNGGALPPGVAPIAAPTNVVRIAGQVQLDRRPLGAQAHALQDAWRLDRPATFRRDRSPPPRVAAERTPPPVLAPAEQLEGIDARTFIRELAELLEHNPPGPADQLFVEGLRRRGVLPRPGEPARADPDLDVLHERGVRRGLTQVLAAAATPPAEVAGHWRVRLGPDPAATSHLRRAAAACAGVFTASPADELPAMVSIDAAGEPLSGDRRYRLRFEPDGVPPVRAFWSLSAGRSTIGDGDGLTIDHDGSLTIYIQPEPPDRREQRSNWLPAPLSRFALVLRLFWPSSDVLERRWSPPAVTRVG